MTCWLQETGKQVYFLLIAFSTFYNKAGNAARSQEDMSHDTCITFTLTDLV